MKYKDNIIVTESVLNSNIGCFEISDNLMSVCPDCVKQ